MAQSPDDAVVVVRVDDGKEFTIKRALVAEHINRGNFKVKSKADEPTEEERKKAVGFDIRKPQSATVPEEKADKKPIEEWTVPELKIEATRLGIEFASNVSGKNLRELITAKLQEIVSTEMEDHEVTQEDLDNNPDLATEGVKVGDIIQLPKQA